ncbi:flagellar basal body rod protein [Oceanidesulfovibrio indonesiensis]|uniref:Flagellar hook protein FlgE n=1 Tax=Oceanidesulfovibrio indonesiensis TaxID=54767 RepID=A0A7M3MGZ4_9BACT|nr:flagellar hook-basal body complex protein [Oceanidesulfovibrio indonesiensis]TVM18757.1 flagellar basal body rod protein [Oceanidesulfovibrio indonesiensis]
MMSSLYIGSTGMKTHSKGMQVLGNDIANVNTVGYKDADFRFADLFSTQVTSQGNGITGYSQKGLGSSLHDIKTKFTQGAMLTTNQDTDLAISGKGFFKVVDNRDNTEFFTRAGNFRFDYQGTMRDPNGFALQGKPVTGIAPDGSLTLGATQDVTLDLGPDGNVVLAPQATSNVSFFTNLEGDDLVSDPASPYFSLVTAYDGTSKPPLNPAYQDTMRVYDSNGQARDLNLYFDKVGTENGVTTWEYVVASNADEDGSNLAGGAGAGLLQAGTLSFNSSGQLISQSAYNYTGDGADHTDLNDWTPAGFDAEGTPSFTARYDGGATATIGLNFGFENSTGQWQGGTGSAAGVSSAGDLVSLNAARAADASSGFAGQGAFTRFNNQNGYAEGFLQRVTFSEDGVMTGSFSNGQKAPLYQIPLYNFTSEDGLRREGKNLYSATDEAGNITENLPGEGAAGLLTGNSLEQSNVDLAREFTHMITTQRGFQANSKIITTSDEILRTALSMKR